MNSMSDTPPSNGNQPTNRAAQLLLAEVMQPSEVAPASSLSLADYKAMCQEMLGGSVVLSEALLQERLAYIRKDSKLKQHFIPGYKYVPVVIPMSTFGNRLPDAEIASGDYLRTLMVDAFGRTVAGFSQQVTRTFDLLPAEIREAAFIVLGYENNEPNGISPKDRDMIAALYEASFRKLQALLV